MDHLSTTGPTNMSLLFPATEITCNVSILSRRGADMAIRKSRAGTWKYPIAEYIDYWTNQEGLLIIGFQPKTGRHIAVVKKSYRRI